MINNYIYNPLLKLNLQQVGGGGDDGANKITKFFSASETLTDNEIAQYQGELDPENNLQPGLFYKQLQGWTKQPDGTTTAYNSTEIIDVTDINDNTTAYPVLTIRNTNTQKKIYNFNNNVKVVMFSESLLNDDLQTFTIAGENLKVYPYPLVNNVWDFENMVQVVNNKLYYNDSLLIFQGSNGGTVGGRFMTDETHENLYLTDFQFIYKIDSELNLLLFEPVILSYVKSYSSSSQTAVQIRINNYKYQFSGAGFVPVPVQTVDEELNENSNNAVSNAAVTNFFNSFKNNVAGVRVMSEANYQALSTKETDVLYFTY